MARSSSSTFIVGLRLWCLDTVGHPCTRYCHSSPWHELIAGRPCSVESPWCSLWFSSHSHLHSIPLQSHLIMLTPKFISPFHLFPKPKTLIQLLIQYLPWDVREKIQHTRSKTKLLFFFSSSVLHLVYLISAKGHYILLLFHSSFSYISLFLTSHISPVPYINYP